MAEPRLMPKSGVPAEAMSLVQVASPAIAVQTRPRHEHTVACQLEQDGFEILLPMFGEVRRWSDRRKLVRVPLFPMYVLVRTRLSCNEERVRVLHKPGVISFVGPRREAVPIAPSQIESVRALMTAQVE
jgi:transcription antitermination factor NusG